MYLFITYNPVTFQITRVPSSFFKTNICTIICNYEKCLNTLYLFQYQFVIEYISNVTNCIQVQFPILSTTANSKHVLLCLHSSCPYRIHTVVYRQFGRCIIKLHRDPIIHLLQSNIYKQGSPKYVVHLNAPSMFVLSAAQTM